MSIYPYPDLPPYGDTSPLSYRIDIQHFAIDNFKTGTVDVRPTGRYRIVVEGQRENVQPIADLIAGHLREADAL